MPAQKPEMTSETIAHAEKLIGLEFSSDARDIIVTGSLDKLDDYHRIRQVKLENDLAPSLQFSPGRWLGIYGDAIEFERHYPQFDVPNLQPPNNLEDLAFWPMTHLAELIRTRQISSVELTQMYIARIKRYNPSLNCVITITEELALAQAQRADAELAQGVYRSPLHGIPYGAKDLIAAKGYPTTWGAMLYKDRVIDVNAKVVERLEAAGAVLIAKLSTGTLANGDVWFGGQTKNPWNINEGAGGSSAGPASATAAGLVGFSIGTETTGSIVWPALRNGVVGVRPTFGLVSRHGVMALSWSMDKIGPIARSVADCTLILNAIYGPDVRDPQMTPFPVKLNFEVEKSNIRVGYVKAAFENRHLEPWRKFASLKPLFSMGIDIREHTANDDQTLEVLRSLGYELVPIELPELEAGLDPMPIIMAVEAAAAFDELTRTGQDQLLLNKEGFRLPNVFKQARFIPAVEYLQANRIRQILMETVAKAMVGVDVVVVPKLGGNNLTLTNLTGHPCVCVPNGFTDEGMPTGIHFVGNLFREAEMLAVAHAVQSATDFHLRRPKMDY
jgi:Asp-tRNA(Asn)/Glu-tRNA(Gln) amidotransferase A subunit family amidase